MIRPLISKLSPNYLSGDGDPDGPAVGVRLYSNKVDAGRDLSAARGLKIPVEPVEILIHRPGDGSEIGNDLDGINAESYIGAEVYLSYTGSISGTISEGADVTQETSGATGVIIALDTTNKKILLRDTRGTFATHATLETLTPR